MKEELDKLFENFELRPLLEDVSLNSARDYVQEALTTGEMIDCPCCGQTVKKYRRKIYGQMLDALKHLNKVNIETGNVLSKMGGGGEYAKLEYWGLIGKLSNGDWSITTKGQKFLSEELRIPKYVYVFNRQIFGFSDDNLISVNEVEKQFDVSELLENLGD